MAISVLKQALEIEELVGSRQGQALLRAEAIVPGAGRDAIETLMSEADLVIGQVDVQEGRVVLEGTAHCQAASPARWSMWRRSTKTATWSFWSAWG